MNDNFHLDDFFHIASKIIFILPVVMVVAALILKFNQKENYSSSQKINTAAIISPTKKVVITPAAIFDLNGPLVCHINEKQVSLSAYIKDKKIFAAKEEKDKIDYFLVKNDCLYWWQKGKYSGEKICGISSYLSYFEQISKFGFMGMEKLDLGSFIGNCKKEEIKDAKIFELPKDILFKNK